MYSPTSLSTKQAVSLQVQKEATALRLRNEHLEEAQLKNSCTEPESHDAGQGSTDRKTGEAAFSLKTILDNLGVHALGCCASLWAASRHAVLFGFNLLCLGSLILLGPFSLWFLCVFLVILFPASSAAIVLIIFVVLLLCMGYGIEKRQSTKCSSRR